MENKIFILGIGAQRSGTTWLHDYLKSHPNVNLGFTKEYHILDALNLNNQTIKKKFFQDRINKVFNVKAKPNHKDILLLKFLGDTNLYFQYFKSLVDEKAETFLTGDITPSYAALNDIAFAEIRQQIIQHGFRPKVIFLLRDPVDRCISQSRMLLKNSGEQLSAASETDHLKQSYTTDDYVIRTRYDLTIKNVETAFNTDEIHYEFYEELYTETAIKALCKKLDIPYLTPDFDHQPNKSRTANIIPAALKLEIANFYEPVYKEIAKKFGVEKIKRIWTYYPSNI